MRSVSGGADSLLQKGVIGLGIFGHRASRCGSCEPLCPPRGLPLGVTMAQGSAAVPRVLRQHRDREQWARHL